MCVHFCACPCVCICTCVHVPEENKSYHSFSIVFLFESKSLLGWELARLERLAGKKALGICMILLQAGGLLTSTAMPCFKKKKKKYGFWIESAPNLSSLCLPELSAQPSPTLQILYFSKASHCFWKHVSGLSSYCLHFFSSIEYLLGNCWLFHGRCCLGQVEISNRKHEIIFLACAVRCSRQNEWHILTEAQEVLLWEEKTSILLSD